MRQFLCVATGVNTAPTAAELHRQPGLWNDYSIRKTFPGTPHADMDDIWVRARARHELTDVAAHKGAFVSEFWPAWHALPSLRPVVFAMMAQAQAVHLGAVLITRLPPGGQILPHVDTDSWHAQYFNAKWHLTLAGQSLSRCDGEAVTMQTGDVWTFDNSVEHSVENPGDTDRIVLIVAMRCEP